MAQSSAKLYAWRITIVCLTILIFGTSGTIASAPRAKPIRDNVVAYSMPTLEFTSKLAGTIALNLVPRLSKRPGCTAFRLGHWKGPPA